MKRLLVGVAFIASACGGNSTAPSSPPPVTPPPVAATFALTGTVSSTNGAAISGATVRVVDGPNAGKSGTSNASGSYSIAGLSAAGQTVNAAATNFFALSKGVNLTGSQSVDFQLAPTPLWTASGLGDAVFDMPTTVARVRIQATPTTSCQNFVVRIGGRASTVNVILGTCSVADARSLDSTYLTGGSGVVSITISTGIQWTFTEVR